MAKIDLPGLRSKTAKGRRYWYHEQGGTRVSLPAPEDPAFAAAFAAAQRRDVTLAGPEGTFDQLISLYRRSRKWRVLQARTRKDYDRVLEWIGQHHGRARPAEWTRSRVVRLMRENEGRLRFANYIKQVLSILFEVAIDDEWMTHNPAKGIPLLEGDGPPVHQPWPMKALAAFLEEAGPVEALICRLCVESGQRIGDVLRMAWGDLKPGGIHVKQGKTGTVLWIPLPADLQADLQAMPRRSPIIVTGRLDRPLSYDACRKRIMRVRVRSGTTGWTIHGWRYTAAHELAGADATDAEIQSITGHKSLAMVRKYAGAARQISQAEAAQAKRRKGVPS